MNLPINGETHVPRDDAVGPDMSPLRALRDVLHLTGTKFGCGVAACGACTAYVDGVPPGACVTPLPPSSARRCA